MSDNVQASQQTPGGPTFASDEVGLVHYPIAKISWGPDGTINVVDDASGKRLPVKIAEALPAGTNNIGDVDVLTLPSLPAGTNNIGDVDVVSSVLPTGAATEAKQDTQITSLQLLDDGIATVGLAVPTKGMAAIGTDGTNAHILKTDTAGELQIDVLSLPALPAGTNNIGDVDVLSLPALPAGTNNIGDVDVLSLPALPAGTNNIGDVDVVSFLGATSSDFLDGVTGAIESTADQQVIAAQGAGVRVFITSILVTNEHATVGTVVEIKDGTTVKARGFAAAGGGGFSYTLATPIKCSLNTAVNAANVTTGAKTYVTLTGYKGA